MFWRHSQRRAFFTTRPNTGRPWLAAGIATVSVGVVSANYTFASSGDEDVLDSFTMEEVAKHTTKDDVWVVVDGYVYDVTNFLSSHPGGAGILLAHAGQDVSKQYAYLKHGKSAAILRSGLLIGKVKDYTSPPPSTVADVPAARQAAGKKSIVVVGAGICGIASAYFLTARGYDVTVLEKACMPGGTGLRSSAIMYLGPLVEKKDSGTVMQWTGQEAYKLLSKIQEEWEDIAFKHRGMLGLAATDEELEMAKLMVDKGPFKGGGEIILTEKLLELEPSLSPKLKGAMWAKNGAVVDPFLLVNAFTKRATANGAQLKYGVEVVGIDRRPQGGFAVAVRAEDGSHTNYKADAVLLAGGWQTKHLASMLGYETRVPVQGVHGQMFATKIEGVTFNHSMFGMESILGWRKGKSKDRVTVKNDLETRVTRHFYTVQTANGVLKFGGDRIKLHLDGDVVKDGMAVTRAHAAEIVPAAGKSDVIGSWSGTMPFTPDQKPIMGALEPGLFVFVGPGVAKGSAFARLMAEWIDGDETHARYKKELSPERFASKD